jgi:trans-aconitate 2-methyltransferase
MTTDVNDADRNDADRNDADWNPTQYHRFADERSRPFVDLLDLVQPGPSVHRAVDLGCGSGELTAMAVDRLGLTDTLGVDNSPAMLAAAADHARPGLRFEHGDIAGWTSSGDHHLVLANASLQWVPHHAAVLARWTAALAPGGQIAVQVPSNAHQPSHVVAREVAALPRFAAAFGPGGPPVDPVERNVLAPEDYARLLYDLGFVHQHVRLQVYPHLLGESRDVVEWVRGTSLTRFQKVLPADVFADFLAEYEARLLDRIGVHSPYFFPFRRVLFWARLP